MGTMTKGKKLFIALLAISIFACAEIPEDFQPVEESAQISETLRMMEYLNAPTTSLEHLDSYLDRRAAENIVAHRNGLDRKWGSSDDDPLETLAELDSIPMVGSSSIEKIREYSASYIVPVGEFVEGLVFTRYQSMAVVWGVNQTSPEELVERIGIRVNAARNLIENAPYQSVKEMAEIS